MYIEILKKSDRWVGESQLNISEEGAKKLLFKEFFMVRLTFFFSFQRFFLIFMLA